MGLTTPTDPLSIVHAGNVCRKWRRIRNECRQLSTSILIQLPIIADAPTNCYFSKRRLQGFLRRLSADLTANVRICIDTKINNSPDTQRIANRRQLMPLLNRAKTLVIHGFDPRGSTYTFCPLFHVHLPPHFFAPASLRSVAFDSVSFRAFQDGPLSMLPLLDFIRACPNIIEVKLIEVKAAPVTVPVLPLALSFLNEICFKGPFLFFQHFFRQVELQVSTRIVLEMEEDDPLTQAAPGYPWQTGHTPDMYQQTLISSLVLVRPSQDKIRSALMVFSNVTSLELVYCTLERGVFDSLPTDGPSLLELTLSRCKFQAEDLHRMYEANRHKTMFERDLLSTLKLHNSEILGWTSHELFSSLRDIIFELFWDDGFLLKHTSRSKLTLHAPCSVAPVVEVDKPRMLTPEPYADFEDFDEYTDDEWQDSHEDDEDEADSGGGGVQTAIGDEATGEGEASEASTVVNEAGSVGDEGQEKI